LDSITSVLAVLTLDACTGWVCFIERYLLACKNGIRAEASINGEEVAEAEVTRRTIDELTISLVAAANSGIPNQAQNAALALGGLVAADTGGGTLTLVDELLGWATSGIEGGEWRCVGATLGLGYAARALRAGNVAVVKRIVTTLISLIDPASGASCGSSWIQFGAAFALGLCTTVDVAALDGLVTPTLCDKDLLQTVVTALVSFCIAPSYNAAEISSISSDAMDDCATPEKIEMVARAHHGHGGALVAIGLTAEQLASSGPGGQRLVLWLHAWAHFLVAHDSSSVITAGALYLLAATTCAGFGARLFPAAEQSVQGAIGAIEAQIGHCGGSGDAYVALAALMHGVTIYDTRRSVDLKAGDLVRKLMTALESTDEATRAVVAIALAHFFGTCESPVSPAVAAPTALLAGSTEETWVLYASIADRLHQVLMKDSDARVRTMAAVGIGMSTLADVHSAEPKSDCTASAIVSFPKGLELGTTMATKLQSCDAVLGVAILRCLQSIPGMSRFAWGTALQHLIRGRSSELRTSAIETLLVQMAAVPTLETVDSAAKQLLAQVLEARQFQSIFQEHAEQAGTEEEGELSLVALLLQHLPMILSLLPEARAGQLVSLVAGQARSAAVPPPLAAMAVRALTATLQRTSGVDGGGADPWPVEPSTLAALHDAATELCDTLANVWETQVVGSFSVTHDESLQYPNCIGLLISILPGMHTTVLFSALLAPCFDCGPH
jgi:hypothetical protein